MTQTDTDTDTESGKAWASGDPGAVATGADSSVSRWAPTDDSGPTIVTVRLRAGHESATESAAESAPMRGRRHSPQPAAVPQPRPPVLNTGDRCSDIADGSGSQTYTEGRAEVIIIKIKRQPAPILISDL